MAFLVALTLWQCSRPDPRQHARLTPAQAPTVTANPAPPSRVARPEIIQKPLQHVAKPSLSMQEWERRNRESMEILRETTPEIDLAP